MELQDEARKLLARGTPHDIAKATELRKRYERIEQRGFSSDELRIKYAEALGQEFSAQNRSNASEYRKQFEKYLLGQIDEEEVRGFLAGSQTISFTAPSQGGTFVPVDADLQQIMRSARRQVDPVLSEDVTDFIQTDNGTLRPAQISGFDLSTITGSLVAEASQQNPQSVPSAAGAVLRNNIIFKATFAASMEAEQDFENFTQKIVAASATALARVISKKVIAGAGGTTDIPGIALALSSTLSNTTGGKLVLADLVNCVYSIDEYWKGSPKCAFLLPPAVAKLARLAVDSQNRPLLDISASDGHLSILGFPCFISPSLATAVCGIGAVGGVLFGDLGTGIVVRTSRPQIQRSVQAAQAGIETGQALFTARCRADAVAWDPSAGANPSVILMTIN